MTTKVKAKVKPKPKTKGTHGGARPGSGPKPGEPKTRRSIGLSERQWLTFDELGGNDWLRIWLDQNARQLPQFPARSS
jgi:hypothetical protein